MIMNILMRIIRRGYGKKGVFMIKMTKKKMKNLSWTERGEIRRKKEENEGKQLMLDLYDGE